MLLWGFV